jgi:hypothetical protein
MKIIRTTLGIFLLAGVAFAQGKHPHERDPDEQAEVEAYRRIFAAAEEIVIYEGLPHPYEEEELLEVESKRKDIVKLPPMDEAFYTPAVEAVNADALLKLLSGPDGIRVNQPKKCGFHSDYCIQFKHQDTTYRAFVCFGCGELSVRKGERGVRFGFNDDELGKLLAIYEKKRPKKVKIE